jgi:glycine cleavage system aminomethyltransferase T
MIPQGPVTPGAPLSDPQGKAIGDVRSTALSPRLGPIALAMVRREVEPGATVEILVDADAGARVAVPAQVVRLPFPIA